RTGQSARALARAREDLRMDVAVDRDLLDERAEHGDDRGVVALARAGRDAHEEELAVERGGHQRRARRMTHFEHQVHVLQVLGELALRLEVALQHAQALDVHGPGIGAAVLEKIEQRLAVQPWRSPKSKPSARARRLRPRMRSMTSLARAPQPFGPM